MKKLLGTTAASVIAAAAFAGSASADNYVYWNVYKDKDVYVNITTYKDFDIDVRVRLDGEATGSAQATALANSIIAGNWVGGHDGVFGQGINRTASMDGSMNENKGIGQVNQDAGNFSNQGNVAAVAWNKENSDVTASEAFVEQNTFDNFAEHTEDSPFEGPDLRASLTNSLLFNSGVYHFNQNVGNGNAQHNVLALAIGSESIVALSEAGLAQDNIGNTIKEINSVKEELIAGSANYNTGIVNVNQAAGNYNNQTTAYSVAILSSSVGLGQ